ncbi:hypothetical protein HMPREF9094_1529 [Fusobacterium animalis ATCC 51191]|uniref:Uncharacterized protein n=1 Tax=Fusobacterium animalis ATCC 51191 TaxID=997347 RepID=F9ENM4_9FUSO|nr:hypothetical protein HMPREF9094_1529 [Fusobacterium animalis ATCC 51191]
MCKNKIITQYIVLLNPNNFIILSKKSKVNLFNLIYKKYILLL